jgi:hypothetical protein
MFPVKVGASTYGLAEQASDIILIHNNIKNAARSLTAPSLHALGMWTIPYAAISLAGVLIF